MPKGIYTRKPKNKVATANFDNVGPGIRLREVVTHELILEHQKAKGSGKFETVCSVNPNGTIRVKINRKPGISLTFTKAQLQALAAIAK